MKCPLKFARYEFEGGEGCIGAECGFYGSVCDMDMSVSAQKRPNDEPPESDVVAILRKYANFWSLSHETHTQCDSNWEVTTMRALADMIERDYVSRQDFEAQHRTLCAVREQRDELTNAINELQKKQPYCYNPEVPLDTLRTVGRYIDELKAERDELKKELDIANAKLAGKPECEICDRATLLEEIEGLTAERDELEMRVNSLVAELGDAEGTSIILERQRDEWKAKVKTLAGYSNYWRGRCAKLEHRSDKRAAAVERLRMLDEFGGGSFEYAILGSDKMTWSYMDKRDALIDLLTDDGAHLKAQSKTEPNLCEQSESSSDEADSREKLEADLKTHLYEFGGYCFSSREGHAGNVDTFFDDFVFLLDRQAAITERECIGDAGKASLMGVVAHERECYEKRIAELQAKVDELYKSCDILRDKKLAAEREKSELTEQLEAAHAKNRALKAHISKMQNGRHGWHVKGVELQRQVDELTAQLHASNAERARLRECLGIATDNAHDLLTLVDESGNVYDRDEGLA